jgi:hypothetical protein
MIKDTVSPMWAELPSPVKIIRMFWRFPILPKKETISAFLASKMPQRSLQSSGCREISDAVEKEFFDSKKASSIPEKALQVPMVLPQLIMSL